VRAIADLVAGPPDDVDLAQLSPLFKEPAPPLPAPLPKPVLQSLAAEVRKLSPGRVPAQAGPDEPPRRVFRLLGGAAEADSLLFAGLAGSSGKMPSVLHLLAQLGSADARNVLGQARTTRRSRGATPGRGT
jgi:hypothetical protein